MIGGRIVRKNYKNLFFAIIILIIIFLALNTNKFFIKNYRSVPVWTNYEPDYYQNTVNEKTGIKDKIINLKNNLKIENLIFYLTGIRPKIPITYLKKEIPMLANYTPGVVKKEEKFLYQSSQDSNAKKPNIIKLKFDIRENAKKRKIKIPESKKDIKKENVIRKIEPEKVVAIYHTHTSETYIDDPRYQDMNGMTKGIRCHIIILGKLLKI